MVIYIYEALKCYSYLACVQVWIFRTTFGLVPGGLNLQFFFVQFMLTQAGLEVISFATFFLLFFFIL